MSALSTPERWFHETATRYVAAQALFHLNEAGVIAALARKPASAEELARALRLKARPLDGLLAYLCRVDPLLTRRGGRYALSAFGRRALARYGRGRNGSREYNLFDVRVGGYGPVWAALGALLRGRPAPRRGALAARGLYRSALGVLPTLRAALRRHRADAALEIGVDTGLAARVAQERLAPWVGGVDLDAGELAAARRRSGARVRWIRGDFFAPAAWAPPGERPLVFTLHLHELAARGVPALRRALAALGRARPGVLFAAFEQPALPDAARKRLPPALWQYSQSNVLIHELTGKGRILRDAEWRRLLRECGGRSVRSVPTGYLGYRLYTARLG